jgi:hypothetical protein
LIWDLDNALNAAVMLRRTQHDNGVTLSLSKGGAK